MPDRARRGPYDGTVAATTRNVWSSTNHLTSLDFRLAQHPDDLLRLIALATHFPTSFPDPVRIFSLIPGSRLGGQINAQIQSRLLFPLRFPALILVSRFGQQRPAIGVLFYRLHNFWAYPIQENDLIAHPATGTRIALLPA